MYQMLGLLFYEESVKVRNFAIQMKVCEKGIVYRPSGPESSAYAGWAAGMKIMNMEDPSISSRCGWRWHALVICLPLLLNSFHAGLAFVRCKVELLTKVGHPLRR